ncbi:winged helix-turn-helix domain-containing protein [Enterococcus quebecensis]|uniref:OmpR/PhoB-type domain-containing protein n=1 Tax=Enterococcus quebecensis TaxID=903983 RepID=A0A1E5GS66_9ENTE|nr:winged helix-turn-helix domain-containing protein [Enterococcus quebecensis]OEG15556.1 hypothetical protein BCR23_08815 [Enterococcus quebecensis]OJG74660.1 hypothetical protein RV12_GL002415 [Enterococcus quebecensis]
MIKLGVIILSGEADFQNLELSSTGEIEFLEINNNDFSIVQTIDGVIIVDEHQQSISKSCGLITQLRNHPKLLIWMYGKEISEVNRLIYLQLGVDGNITEKEKQELFLIVRNTVSRIKQNKKENKELHLFKLHKKNQSVLTAEGKEISLTNLEFKALNHLCQQPGQALSYSELSQGIWGENIEQYRPRLANVIFHIREKLEQEPYNFHVIKTVRSIGYMFVPPV